MKKHILFLLTAAFVLAGLTGCGKPGIPVAKTQYQATFLELFDTVTTVVGFASSEEEFKETAEEIRSKLEVYHRLFDIYEEYEGIANLKTINDQAGVAPVEVDPVIIELLLDCREYYELTDGRVNAAMGSILSLWHETRQAGIDDPLHAKLPEEEELKQGREHLSFENVLIDEENNTVFLTDPEQSLDVGAIAKGWAVQRTAEEMPEGMLLSVGGNVCATGPKPQSETPWVVGIQSPENPEEFLHTIYLSKGCLVSSGDYQRYYEVDGVKYHHIIDPETGYPSGYWRSVSIVCEDSGLADALSTALFLMPYEEGKQLLESLGGEAVWVDKDGNRYYSTGFEEMIRT